MASAPVGLAGGGAGSRADWIALDQLDRAFAKCTAAAIPSDTNAP